MKFICAIFVLCLLAINAQAVVSDLWQAALDDLHNIEKFGVDGCASAGRTELKDFPEIIKQCTSLGSNENIPDGCSHYKAHETSKAVKSIYDSVLNCVAYNPK